MHVYEQGNDEQAILHNIFIEKNYLNTKKPFLTFCKKWLFSQDYDSTDSLG